MFRADPAGAGGSKGEQDAPVNVGRHLNCCKYLVGSLIYPNISKFKTLGLFH